MHRDSLLRRLLGLPAGEGRRVAQEIDAEIDFHLSERIAELIATGATMDEARERAGREFGDRAAAQEELTAIDHATVRRARRVRAWSAVVTDVRLGVRGLRRSPMFGLAVIITLGLGIGVNAAMFGITDRLLLSPPPHVRDADASSACCISSRRGPLWARASRHSPRWSSATRDGSS